MEQRRRPSNAGEDEMLRCAVCRRTSAAEALLLPCLHSCCAACIAGLRKGDSCNGSGNVRGEDCERAASQYGAVAATKAICPLCEEAVPSIEALRRNLHAAAIERSRCERAAGAACDGCRRGSAADATASESAASATQSSATAAYRCIQCRISLCGACKQEHEKFLQRHDIQMLDAYYASRDTAAEAAVAATAAASASCGLCAEHGRELEFACEQCGGLRCGRCLALCLREHHSLTTIDECVSGARVDLAAAVDAAHEQLAALDADAARRGERVAALEALRGACRQQLTAGRERARAWLDECHDAAWRAVDEHVDALVGEQRRGDSEAVLRGRVEYACDYGASMLRHDDAASVLDQRELVCERLRRLAAAAADATATAALAEGGSRTIVVESRQTEDVRSALRELVGVPRLIAAAEDKRSEDDNRLSVFADSNGTSDHFSFTYAESGSRGMARTTRYELAFHEPTHFQTPVQCSDVAVTGDGCIVLATGMGLREYDSGGVELAAVNVNCWYACVDVLGDGRVTAGNSARRQIEIFTRPGTAAVSWRLAGVMATGVEAELLAVAADADPTAAAHDRRLWLYDASGRQTLSKTLDYNIAALAVAPDRVVLVSFNAVSRGGFLVEAYSGDGATLWRHSNSERTWGVCADRWGNAYLALVNRNAVRVLGSDGRQQADVLRGRRLASPWRLAVDRAGTRLVVLSHDRCSLSVFPATVSAAEATLTEV